MPRRRPVDRRQLWLEEWIQTRAIAGKTEFTGRVRIPALALESLCVAACSGPLSQTEAVQFFTPGLQVR